MGCSSQIVKAYAGRLDKALRKLAGKAGADVSSFEVREIVGELDFVAKQLYQMKDASAFMLQMAQNYQHDKAMQERLDRDYGKGSTAFIGQALEAFYTR